MNYSLNSLFKTGARAQMGDRAEIEAQKTIEVAVRIERLMLLVKAPAN